VTDAPLLVANGEPAAGAPFGELVPAAIVAVAAVGALVVVGIAHRSGRVAFLNRAGALAERLAGLPRWASLPAAVAAASLLVAVFGFYWDVATHIDNGRDPGPFANPSHYLIIAGLAGIALAGAISVLLGSGETPTPVRVRAGWRAPVGGVLLLLCGAIAVVGFPLDDVWHRLFGQDVTLWSPTHLQMVGGAALSTLALWILLVEGRRAVTGGESQARRWRFAETFAAGSLLIGLSALHAEFDYSVPQFRLLYHPVILMLSAGTALVAARIRLGRGGAVKAVLVFLGIRAALSLVVGPLMGHTTLHFPLYLAEAIVVEAVARVVGTSRQITFGAVCGAAIGTVGLAAEWGWSHLWMTIPWPASLLPEGAVLGVVAAVTGGVLGAIIGRALSDPVAPRQGVPRVGGALTVAGVLLVLAYPFPTDASLDGSATVSLRRIETRDDRWAVADIRLAPSDAAEDAEWFNVTAWQGGGSVVQQPERVAGGKYRTTDPIPVAGEWKALLRLQRGNSLVAVPVYLPKDPAIPAPEVPAVARFTRPFTYDKEIVLREAKEVSPALTYGASGVMIAIAALFTAMFVWGLARLDGGGSVKGTAPRATPAPTVGRP
jgi:hypothetical protein